MKNIIPLFITALILFSICSCKNHNKSQDNPMSPEALASASENMTDLNPETFKAHVFDYTQQNYKFEGDLPCIIFFYASWSGQCKLMARDLQTVLEKYKNRIRIYKVDTDLQTKLSMDFGIKGIPALIYCPKSGNPQYKTGVASRENIEKSVQSFLLK